MEIDMILLLIIWNILVMWVGGVIGWLIRDYQFYLETEVQKSHKGGKK